MKYPNRDILLVSLLILLSRIPFLFSGYGSEEDAWGLILTARKISLSGVYEVSRMPGHPIQELLLSLIWDWPSWVLNFLTAIVSTTGIAIFMITLRRLQIPNPIPAGLALAFVPAVFINSSNVMDYTWAFTFTMCSFYLLTKKRLVIAGIFLGIAAGLRITALGMALPFALLLTENKNIKATLNQLAAFWLPAALVAIVAFMPPYRTYGPGFFMYYQYFPDPPLLKNIYKATVGAWGLAGFAGLAIALPFAFRNYLVSDVSRKQNMLTLLCLAAMSMYLFAYFKLPQKSAFVIPTAPFVIILLVMFLRKQQMQFFAGAMVISSLLLGINLDDPIRGSGRSPVSFGFTAAGSNATVDLLYGPVVADLSKRKNKIAYAKKITEQSIASGKNILIIAGWFQNEIEYQMLDKKREKVVTVYYAGRDMLSHYRKFGYTIYHLPEQDIYNDQRYKGSFTSAFSVPFPVSGN